ncbi:MAG: glycosyltransferase [Melioribacteraceae bacterium]|nr:glycosyltransferase [Melioribacteraceae bacterium]
MNAQLEKISILISNFNNSRFVEESIESVINQTSDRWKIYLIGASTNNSKNIYSKYENNPKIRIIYNEENIGYVKSIKRLIEQSENDIIGILEADDKLHETAIEKVLNKYSMYYKAGFVYTNFWFCDKNINSKKLGFCKLIPNGFTNLDSLFTSYFITFRKSIYEKTDGYDESILHTENIDLVYKMEEVTRLHFVNEPLYYLRKDEKSISKRIKKRVQQFKNNQKAKDNAYQRRGLPNRNSLIERVINPDFDYFKKRRIRKTPSTINKNDGLENLLSAKKIFKKLGIDYWLTDGTLLGYYREKDFIKHDCDLDLGSFIKDYDDRIIREFLNEGWELYRTYGKKNLGFELSLIRDYLQLDIFFFYEESGKLWHGAWHKTKEGLNLIKYYYEPFELGKGEFLNHEFSIPKDTLKYITTKYGESWNKPVKNWDWADGPSNSKRTSIFL